MRDEVRPESTGQRADRCIGRETTGEVARGRPEPEAIMRAKTTKLQAAKEVLRVGILAARLAKLAKPLLEQLPELLQELANWLL